MGVLAGARSLTPLAAVSDAARRGLLPHDSIVGAFLSQPAISAGLKLLALGEMLGDKMPSAPDRIVAPGMAARIATGGLAGAAVAPRGERGPAVLLGVIGAVGAAHLSFRLRMWALRRYGQTRTGLIEDAVVLVATQALLHDASRSARHTRLSRL